MERIGRIVGGSLLSREGRGKEEDFGGEEGEEIGNPMRSHSRFDGKKIDRAADKKKMKLTLLTNPVNKL